MRNTGIDKLSVLLQGLDIMQKQLALGIMEVVEILELHQIMETSIISVEVVILQAQPELV